MYYVVLAVFAAVFALIRRIVHSPFGRCSRPSATTSLARSRLDTISTATNCWHHPSAALSVSPIFEDLGARFTTLSDVLQANSGEVILMTLLGGSGHSQGPSSVQR